MKQRSPIARHVRPKPISDRKLSALGGTKDD